jgi:hypothetical protein
MIHGGLVCRRTGDDPATGIGASRSVRDEKILPNEAGLADRSQNAALEKSEHRNKVDWGGTVAWWLASCWPERLVRMVIANAPHPVVWCAAMEDDSEQRRKSRYARLLRIPLLPES